MGVDLKYSMVQVSWEFAAPPRLESHPEEERSAAMLYADLERGPEGSPRLDETQTVAAVERIRRRCHRFEGNYIMVSRREHLSIRISF
jgi:hypothetical protein